MPAGVAARRVRRGSKKIEARPVSPFRQSDEERHGPRPEVVCFKCSLPSYRGLPPFVYFGKDEDDRKLYGHNCCPQESEALLVAVTDDRTQRRVMWERIRKSDTHVVSYHVENGETVRKVIA